MQSSEITVPEIHVCCERISHIPQYFFCNLFEHDTSRAEQGSRPATNSANTTARLSRHDEEGSTALLTSGFAAVCLIMAKFAIGSLCSETCDIFQPSRGDPDRTTSDRARPGQARRKEPRDRWATLRNLIGIDIIAIMHIMTLIRVQLKQVLFGSCEPGGTRKVSMN
jgi:hypothetical protein